MKSTARLMWPPSENEFDAPALIEIKNNLQENNSRVDEAENQINDLEHKEAKNNQSEQQEEKEYKKMRIV